jgi:hypothetical protein
MQLPLLSPNIPLYPVLPHHNSTACCAQSYYTRETPCVVVKLREMVGRGPMESGGLGTAPHVEHSDCVLARAITLATLCTHHVGKSH